MMTEDSVYSECSVGQCSLFILLPFSISLIETKVFAFYFLKFGIFMIHTVGFVQPFYLSIYCNWILFTVHKPCIVLFLPMSSCHWNPSFLRWSHLFHAVQNHNSKQDVWVGSIFWGLTVFGWVYEVECRTKFFFLCFIRIELEERR